MEAHNCSTKRRIKDGTLNLFWFASQQWKRITTTETAFVLLSVLAGSVAHTIIIADMLPSYNKSTFCLGLRFSYSSSSSTSSKSTSAKE